MSAHRWGPLVSGWHPDTVRCPACKLVAMRLGSQAEPFTVWKLSDQLVGDDLDGTPEPSCPPGAGRGRRGWSAINRADGARRVPTRAQAACLRAAVDGASVLGRAHGGVVGRCRELGWVDARWVVTGAGRAALGRL